MLLIATCSIVSIAKRYYDLRYMNENKFESICGYQCLDLSECLYESIDLRKYFYK